LGQALPLIGPIALMSATKLSGGATTGRWMAFAVLTKYTARKMPNQRVNFSTNDGAIVAEGPQ
jgi:hypothetical protein